MKEKKKILFIHHGTGITGAAKSLCEWISIVNINNEFNIKVLLLKQDKELLEYFTKQSIDTSIVSSRFYTKFNRFFTHIEPFFYKYYHIIGLIRVFISWCISSFLLSKRILKKEHPDIVHLNSSILTDWLYSAKKLGLKTVIHIREPISSGYFGLRYKILKYLINKYSDKIIAISKDNADRVKQKKSLVEIEVIYNQINLNDNFIKKTKLGFDSIKFLYVGGFHKIKGFNVICDAILKNEKVEGVSFVFAGYYPLINNNSIKRYIKSLFIPSYRNRLIKLKKINNREDVNIIGFQNNIQSILEQSNILIFPAIKSHFPRPIIEANYLNIPVIASNIKGMNEVVKDQHNGLLFKTNNYYDLRSKINYFVTHKEAIKKMGVNGKIFVENNILTYDNYKKVTTFYSDLI